MDGQRPCRGKRGLWSPSVTRGRGAAIVATLGRSPHLADALSSLRRSGGGALRILLVAPEAVLVRPPVAECLVLADEIVSLEHNLGFAGNNNQGIARGSEDWVALVNDDAVVDPSWWPRLSRVLADDETLAAVQGTVVSLADPTRIDGRGLAWNGWWQAVQIDHGERSTRADGTWDPGADHEIFGVSATAALYRRSALEAVGRPGARPFDEELHAYYEDVELAIRLRAAGWRSRWVAGAGARHAGSLTGDHLPWGKGRWLVGNRWRVLMDLLGRRFLRHLPRIAARDLRDVVAGPGRGRRGLAYGAGWLRALAGAPRAMRWGPPRLATAELERFRVAPGHRARYHPSP